MSSPTMLTVQRRDLASQRWEVWIWDDENGAVVEWCDTYDELLATQSKCVAKAKKFLTFLPQ